MDLLGSGASGPDRGVLVEARPFLLHATPMVDVAVRLDDGRVERHRLGAESVDDGLEAGAPVVLERVMAMVVGVRRA